MQLHTDYSVPALSRAGDTEWVPSPLKGVDRKMLERNGNEVARATTIVRYAAGSFFSPHVHTGGEEFIVLDGTFSDEHGDYPAGMYVRNPVGSKHKPFSEKGCTILVKLWQYPAEDQEFVRIDMFDFDLWPASVDGTTRLTLHETEHEHVEAVRLGKGAKLTFADDGGLELFIVSGAVQTESGSLGAGDWLRLPIGSHITVKATENALLYKKAGHLTAPPPLPSVT